jgi:hypothetical protein
MRVIGTKELCILRLAVRATTEASKFDEKMTLQLTTSVGIMP